MLWTRIDPGTALTSGSWSRGVLWGATNRFVVFGNRRGNLVEDYNRRVVNWEHVAYVELESLGIYQPPVPRLESAFGGALGPGMDLETAVGTGMMISALGVWWMVGRWEKAKKKWWRDWERIGQGLERDVKVR